MTSESLRCLGCMGQTVVRRTEQALVVRVPFAKFVRVLSSEVNTRNSSKYPRQSEHILAEKYGKLLGGRKTQTHSVQLAVE